MSGTCWRCLPTSTCPSSHWLCHCLSSSLGLLQWCGNDLCRIYGHTYAGIYIPASTKRTLVSANFKSPKRHTRPEHLPSHPCQSSQILTFHPVFEVPFGKHNKMLLPFQRWEPHTKDRATVCSFRSFSWKHRQLILLVLAKVRGGDYSPRRYSERLHPDPTYLFKCISACFCMNTKWERNMRWPHGKDPH